MGKFPIHIAPNDDDEVEVDMNYAEDGMPTSRQESSRHSLVLKEIPASQLHVATSAKMTITQLAESLAGFMYIIATIIASILYLNVLYPNLSNDMWWVGFNASGTQSYLGELCNLHLSLGATSEIDILASTSIIFRTFSNDSTAISTSPVYARMMIMESTTTLDEVITGLHTSKFPSRLSTQYCWVDFNKKYELAHTRMRQNRCSLKYIDNGAVYFEAILRNVEWSELERTIGGSHGSFTVGIESAIDPQWLETVRDAFVDVESEVAYWRSHTVHRWQLQWHNGWQSGIDETIAIENALGIRQDLAIKKVLYTGHSWTSMILNLGFWNELAYAQQSNCSLVRGAPCHISEKEFESIAGVREGVLKDIWNQALGPYGTIDATWVAVPTSLVSAVAEFRYLFIQLLEENPSILESFNRLLPIVIDPAPSLWQYGVSYSSSPLCPNSLDLTLDIRSSFSFDDTCLMPQIADIDFNPSKALFALLMLREPFSVNRICSHCIQTHVQCTEYLSQLTPVLSKFTSMISLPAWSELNNISIVQIIEISNQITLMNQSLVNDSTDSWSFYGWIMLYEWTFQSREVVLFEGDRGSLVLISAQYEFHSFNPSSLGIPHRAVGYIKFVALYVTTLLCLVAILMVGYGFFTQFRVLGRNLFRFNRVAGFVWVGRIFLAVRGLMGIVLLSTPSIELIQVNGATRFSQNTRSFVEKCLIIGETGWMMYVFHDFLAAFVKEHSYYAASISSALANIIVFIVDITTPVHATITLERKCEILVMGQHIACNAGVVQYGSRWRVLWILGIQVSCICIIYSLAGIAKWKRETPLVTLHMTSASEAFLDMTSTDDTNNFDKVTCIMCGLLPFSWGRHEMVADLKAWIIFTHSNGRRQSCTFSIPSFVQNVLAEPESPFAPLFRWKERFLAFIGFGYMVGSLTSSVLYISSTEVNMANDFWWPHFNSTGAHAYLGTWFNEQLLLATSFTATLDNTIYADSTSYGISSSTIPSSGFEGRLVQFEALSDMARAILGLRSLSICQLPWISTQYCWLDFQKEYSMAYTSKRQERCAKSYSSNGAVYLATGLRNVNWMEASECSMMDIVAFAFENELRRTSRGQAQLKTWHDRNTTEEEELDVWRSHGLTHYTTQFQNFKKLGVVEVFHIQNALGIDYPMTIKASRGAFQIGAQTSFALYWPFAYDLWAISDPFTFAQLDINEKCLLSGSSDFVFANISITTTMAFVGIIQEPFNQKTSELGRTLGPFGTMDARHIPVPITLRHYYKTISHFIANLVATNNEAQALYYELPLPNNFAPIPNQWRNVNRSGGNILCPDMTPTSAKTMLSFWSDRGCTSTAEMLYPTRISSVAAAIVAQATDSQFVCQLETLDPRNCIAYMLQIQSFIDIFVSMNTSSAFAALATIARHDVLTLNVSLLQFAMDGSPLVHGLLNNKNEMEFDLFGWTFAIEWIQGKREVVSFEGDTGILVLLSTYYIPMDYIPMPLEIPVNVALYSRGIVIYVTGMLALVAALASVYIILNHGRVEGMNVLEINRVAGLAWTGRPLLMARSIVAICLLSTSELKLNRFGVLGFMTAFKAHNLEAFTVILASAEVMWLVYVVTDILIPVTKGHTTNYAPTCSLFVWLTTAVLSFMSPVSHHIVVHRDCSANQYDFQSTCIAGTIYIGSSNRLYLLLSLSLVGILGCYAYERWRYPQKEDKRKNHSLLLSGSARYLYSLDNTTYMNCVYLDKASAVITGLLCIEIQDIFYVLDIKLWRLLIIQVPEAIRVPSNHIMYDRVQHALPLIGKMKI